MQDQFCDLRNIYYHVVFCMKCHSLGCGIMCC